MSATYRFGRRIAIPATRQIRHDYNVYCEAQERARLAAIEGLAATASWDDIVAKQVRRAESHAPLGTA